MPKPVQVPTWATDETNNTEPSAGQKATGWTPGQIGVSDYDNWYKQRSSLWLTYLNTIISTVGADERLTIGEVSAERLYFSDVRKRYIPACAAAEHGTGTGWIYGGDGWSTQTTTSLLRAIRFPIMLETGEQITLAQLHVVKSSNAGTTLQFQLHEYDHAADTTTVVGTGTLATNAPGYTAIIALGAGFPKMVIDARSYWVEVIVSNGGLSSSTDEVRTLELWTSRPTP